MNKAKKITIWVHGTRGASFILTGITPEIRKIEHDVCTVPLGLNKATTLETHYYQRKIAHMLSESSPEEFPLEHFYVFGWSGKLNLQAREHAGKDFYHAISKLIHEYTTSDGIPPLVTIITHSHGGNVALNLAMARDEDHNHIDFHIDRLILMACPVQNPTARLIAHSMFKKAYVLFSPFDQIQILDPQRLHILSTGIKQAFSARCWQTFINAWKGLSTIPLFSSRTFTYDHHIKQVALFWKDRAPWTAEDVEPFGSYGPWVKKWVDQFDNKRGRGLAHLEFMLPLFLKQLPDVIHRIEQASPNNDMITLVL